MVQIPSFFDWFSGRQPYFRDGWAILGKGPSLSAVIDRPEVLHDLPRLGLNDVCRVVSVDITHVTDLEVLGRSGPAVLARGGTVVLPFYPHVDFKPNPDYSLPQILEGRGLQDGVVRTLRTLVRDGRLVTYRSSRSDEFEPNAAGPAVVVRAFSAVAAVNLLGRAGVKRVVTVGVDGGTKYAAAFRDLTPLTNGRRSFDAEFPEIRAAEARFGLKVTPYGTAT